MALFWATKSLTFRSPIKEFMKNVLILISSVAILCSCSKSDGPTPTPPDVITPAAPDTLGSGWSKIGNIPATESVSDIYFADNSNGYATTDLGIYRTTDAGSNWTKINSDQNFINISGWGSKALFLNQTRYTYNTQNNGIDLLKTPNDVFQGTGFQEACYSSSNVAYVASLVYLWKSTNGGASFDTIHNFRTGDGGCNLFFLNDMQGWASRDRKLFKTENGGIDWSVSATLSNRVGPVFFLNTDVGYYCDNATIYKTTNGGTSWDAAHSFPPQFMITDIHFISQTTGYASAGNKIYKTTDGGNSWSTSVALGDKNVTEIFFQNDGSGWACGDYGYVLRFRP